MDNDRVLTLFSVGLACLRQRENARSNCSSIAPAKAYWDADRVWRAECAENRGAATEAASVEGIMEAIQKTFPDLVDYAFSLGKKRWARLSGWRSTDAFRATQLGKRDHEKVNAMQFGN
jgi:Domain of unknown function (DUF1902)